ncbi:hypothetical protein KQI89_14730 [Clostridium sp. MSJ-4]|uniref:Uncharacterized protein n=1 Tax=Clostridium simiarum TaxID=2841506 RepID=A0ABS6F583_9CLOT|nr:hypothetical protein [Clostridium simiarum]MBU5593004.1 hypothetical protein [Clostridium simiarum]
MKNTENLNTGFYGETMPLLAEKDGKVLPIYRDAGVYITDDEIRTERQMKINGRPYYVTSIFPTFSESTPTEKIIELMELELNNKVG